MARQNPTCIYCLETKVESAFNTEHVLPRAYGRFQGICPCGERVQNP
jgi:hypothetical protein